MFLMTLLFTSLMTNAYEGTFEFKNEMELLQERQIIVLPTFKYDEVKQLQKEGYRCPRRGRFYKCSTFIKPATWPGSPVTPLRQRVVFEPIQAKKLLSESDLVTQFEATQPIQIDGEHYEKAIYTVTPQLKKIEVGPDSERPIHFILEENHIVELQFEKETENRFRWTDYMIGVEYRRLGTSTPSREYKR